MTDKQDHAAWRKKFRDCRHKFIDPRRRCSYRPNGNPYCDLLGIAVRCRFSRCPKK